MALNCLLVPACSGKCRWGQSRPCQRCQRSKKPSANSHGSRLPQPQAGNIGVREDGIDQDFRDWSQRSLPPDFPLSQSLNLCHSCPGAPLSAPLPVRSAPPNPALPPGYRQWIGCDCRHAASVTMQKVHLLLQPSCTLINARVRDLRSISRVILSVCRHFARLPATPPLET